MTGSTGQKIKEVLKHPFHRSRRNVDDTTTPADTTDEGYNTGPYSTQGSNYGTTAGEYGSDVTPDVEQSSLGMGGTATGVTDPINRDVQGTHLGNLGGTAGQESSYGTNVGTYSQSGAGSNVGGYDSSNLGANSGAGNFNNDSEIHRGRVTDRLYESNRGADTAATGAGFGAVSGATAVTAEAFNRGGQGTHLGNLGGTAGQTAGNFNVSGGGGGYGTAGSYDQGLINRDTQGTHLGNLGGTAGQTAGDVEGGIAPGGYGDHRLGDKVNDSFISAHHRGRRTDATAGPIEQIGEGYEHGDINRDMQGTHLGNLGGTAGQELSYGSNIGTYSQSGAGSNVGQETIGSYDQAGAGTNTGGYDSSNYGATSGPGTDNLNNDSEIHRGRVIDRLYESNRGTDEAVAGAGVGAGLGAAVEREINRDEQGTHLGNLGGTAGQTAGDFNTGSGGGSNFGTAGSYEDLGVNRDAQGTHLGNLGGTAGQTVGDVNSGVGGGNYATAIEPLTDDNRTIVQKVKDAVTAPFTGGQQQQQQQQYDADNLTGGVAGLSLADQGYNRDTQGTHLGNLGGTAGQQVGDIGTDTPASGGVVQSIKNVAYSAAGAATGVAQGLAHAVGLSGAPNTGNTTDNAYSATNPEYNNTAGTGDNRGVVQKIRDAVTAPFGGGAATATDQGSYTAAVDPAYRNTDTTRTADTSDLDWPATAQNANLAAISSNLHGGNAGTGLTAGGATGFSPAAGTGGSAAYNTGDVQQPSLGQKLKAAVTPGSQYSTNYDRGTGAAATTGYSDTRTAGERFQEAVAPGAQYNTDYDSSYPSGGATAAGGGYGQDQRTIGEKIKDTVKAPFQSRQEKVTRADEALGGNTGTVSTPEVARHVQDKFSDGGVYSVGERPEADVLPAAVESDSAFTNQTKYNSTGTNISSDTNLNRDQEAKPAITRPFGELISP